jgi:site-specific DNA recombinase
MKLAAIYARVSSESQEKQETVQSQILALKEFANQNNYSIVSEYIDNGYSGAMLARPSLDRLRDDADKGLFETVLIHSPDLLARKYVYQELIKIELNRLGVNIVFTNCPATDNKPENLLLDGMQGLIAEYEKTKIMERTRRGKMYKAKQGIIISNRAPYGYRYILKDRNRNESGYYEIVETEAVIVKDIFDSFTKDSKSFESVAKELNQRKIKPRYGKEWKATVIRNILKNEVYVGIVYYNKSYSIESGLKKENLRRVHTVKRKRSKDEWISIKLPDTLKIVDESIFKLAQEQMKKNSQRCVRESRFEYLLKGFVECGECSHHLVGTSSHDIPKYRCFGYRSLKDHCGNKAVKSSVLDEIVWNAICDLIRSPKLMAKQANNFYQQSVSGRNITEKEISGIEKKIGGLIEHRNRVLDAYTEGIINKDIFSQQMLKINEKEQTLFNQKLECQQKLEDATKSNELEKNIYDYCEKTKKKLENLSFNKKREILKQLLRKVIVKNNGEIVVKLFIEHREDVLCKSGEHRIHTIPPRFFDIKIEAAI